MTNMNPKRIKLINCDKEILDSILKGNRYLSQSLKLNVPPKWTEFGDPIFKHALKKIEENPASQIWWTYLAIIIQSNTLIGSCGFKGEPNENGFVEIGYEVATVFRNQGYATEIVKLLIEIAFQFPKVIAVLAHTLAEKNASVKVLKKCNFEFVEELEDEEDGTIWKWELRRN